VLSVIWAPAFPVLFRLLFFFFWGGGVGFFCTSCKNTKTKKKQYSFEGESLKSRLI
jgi:hypothetical protein